MQGTYFDIPSKKISQPLLQLLNFAVPSLHCKGGLKANLIRWCSVFKFK
jgi:hypothetical protein